MIYTIAISFLSHQNKASEIFRFLMQNDEQLKSCVKVWGQRISWIYHSGRLAISKKNQVKMTEINEGYEEGGEDLPTLSHFWSKVHNPTVLVRDKKSGPPLFYNRPVVWDDQRLIKLTDHWSSFCSPSPCSKMLKDCHNHHRMHHPTQRGCLILFSRELRVVS